MSCKCGNYNDIDLSKVEEGKFYPSRIDTAEDEGKFFAAYFETVEICGKSHPFWNDVEVEILERFYDSFPIICRGKATIDGREKIIEVVKFPK